MASYRFGDQKPPIYKTGETSERRSVGTAMKPKMHMKRLQTHRQDLEDKKSVFISFR